MQDGLYRPNSVTVTVSYRLPITLTFADRGEINRL